MDILMRWLLIALLIYLAGGALLYFFQRSFLYFPRSYVHVPQLEEIGLTSHGIRLHGYIANSGQEHLLLYLGGNAERIAKGIAQMATHLPHTTIIGFDYRGYGKSAGSPSEQALYEDALAQFDAYAKDYRQVTVLGRSLGSTVAVHLASKRPVDKLVLVTPVDSVARIAASRFWFYPIHILIKDRYDAIARAGAVDVPVLMLAAGDDHLVDPGHLREFQQAFASDCAELVNLPGVGHNNIQDAPEFFSFIRAFTEDENPQICDKNNTNGLANTSKIDAHEAIPASH